MEKHKLHQPTQIIEIIDHYQVKINKGSNSGIKTGQIFEIFKSDKSNPGSDAISKGIGEVISVEEGISTLKSIGEKTGGKKIITKTGSGEAFEDLPLYQDSSTTVDPEPMPLPFSNPQKGDIVKLK